MRVPISWLREFADVPAGESGRAIADRLVAAGLEVETVDVFGDVSGPVVVGEVVSFVDEPQKNGKSIRWCTVNVGDAHGGERGIVCGASNFAVGDRVVVALPDAVLPGGFAISARKTYGHVSDGMICSSRELGLGQEHDGILILEQRPAIGATAVEVLGLGEEVLDIAVTPDRGYCLSIRGVAREAATAYGLAFNDPASLLLPRTSGDAHQVSIDDHTGADRIVLRTVTGFNAKAESPDWMQRRLLQSGMRPISLAVDITNYVMLEIGQPLHAFDRAKLTGPLTIRRAHIGETITTLDGVDRELDVEDVVVADNSGAIAIGGTMGGASTEVDDTTTDIVIEAAHFDAVVVARQVRRHRLPSEAAKRFERGMDHELGPIASARAVALLVEHGGAEVVGSAEVDLRPSAEPIAYSVGRAGRVAGLPIGRDVVVRNLVSVGCAVTGDDELTVRPPSWRPDLTDPADLDEEVIRLIGYDVVPSTLPTAPAGVGLTKQQRAQRAIGRALAGDGYVEVLSYPFVGENELDALMFPADDGRRRSVRLANPMSDEQPFMRTTLLPGLLSAVRRNLGRGQTDLAVFEHGSVYRWPEGHTQGEVPRPSVAGKPSMTELAELGSLLPDEQRRIAAVLTGARELAGWWGPAQESTWADAVEAARLVATAVGLELEVRSDTHEPWHPGRCAALVLDGRVIGHAGELHPRVIEALGLPARTSAMEMLLTPLLDGAKTLEVAPEISSFPVAKEDLAVVVSNDVPVQAVADALREGAGPLLESLRLFDVYTGPQVGEGQRSLAFALRFRAPDRTLADTEVAQARQAALAQAAQSVGAVLRA